MRASEPKQDAEDLDELAVRRSTRTASIVIAAVVVLTGILMGYLVSGQVHPRPVGVQHRPSLWVIVLIVALAVVLIAATALAMVLWLRWLYRRPGYRRIMQYSWRRRRRVNKDLRRGRTLLPEDIPVAAAMVDLMRAQRRQNLVGYVVAPVFLLLGGLIQHGAQRWFYLTLTVTFLVLIPISLRQQQQLNRNYDRQIATPVEDH